VSPEDLIGQAVARGGPAFQDVPVAALGPEGQRRLGLRQTLTRILRRHPDLIFSLYAAGNTLVALAMLPETAVNIDQRFVFAHHDDQVPPGMIRLRFEGMGRS